MKRTIPLALLILGLTFCGEASAQRRVSRGPAMTPYGPVYDPALSAEWRQAGGNPIIYQQMMMQKMMAAEQKAEQQQLQALRKQQQAFEKWLKDQKALKDKGKPVDPAYQQILDQEARVKAAQEAQAAKVAARKARVEALKKKHKDAIAARMKKAEAAKKEAEAAKKEAAPSSGESAASPSKP